MSDPAPRNESPPNGWGPLGWFRDVALSIVLAVILIVFIYQPVKVEGTSMMPTLIEGERIFINKITYTLGSGRIDRGDTVVFWYPLDPSKSYIKRVIGVPGDVVEIVDGTVILNGQRLQEPYLIDVNRDRMSMTRRVIEPAHYFVLGDHRNSSNDSRSWGTVPRDAIYGKAVFVYWPLNRLGLLR